MAMQQLDLTRHEASEILGAGAGYDVQAAVDTETGKQVVLKQSKPQMVSHPLH